MDSPEVISLLNLTDREEPQHLPTPPITNNERTNKRKATSTLSNINSSSNASDSQVFEKALEPSKKRQRSEPNEPARPQGTGGIFGAKRSCQPQSGPANKKTKFENAGRMTKKGTSKTATEITTPSTSTTRRSTPEPHAENFATSPQCDVAVGSAASLQQPDADAESVAVQGLLELARPHLDQRQPPRRNGLRDRKTLNAPKTYYQHQPLYAPGPLSTSEARSELHLGRYVCGPGKHFNWITVTKASWYVPNTEETLYEAVDLAAGDHPPAAYGRRYYHSVMAERLWNWADIRKPGNCIGPSGSKHSAEPRAETGTFCSSFFAHWQAASRCRAYE